MKNDDLKIIYNKSLKLMSINPSAWSLTGPLQWFTDYKIISNIKNPLEKQLHLLYLTDYIQSQESVPRTVRQMKESPALLRLIKHHALEDYAMIMTKPNTQGPPVAYLSNDYTISTKYENKVWFRENYGSVLNFPKFVISRCTELSGLNFDELTASLESNGLVVQHPSYSGGRGTSIVKNQQEFDQAVEALSISSSSKDDSVVISQLINAPKERTLQVCVTSDDIYVGPPQSQLVAHPQLVSSDLDSVQFCGGMIKEGLLSDEHYKEAQAVAHLIGTKLRQEGYRGIFGLDMLVADGNLYVIEVNSRLTGLTALLSFLQKEVPFLLLHILELAKSEYALQQPQLISEKVGSGSFVVLYTKNDLEVDCHSGVYNADFQYQDSGFEESNILPKNNQDYFVAMKRNFGSIAPTGKSIAFIYSKRELFDDEGNLDPGLMNIINGIQKIRNK